MPQDPSSFKSYDSIFIGLISLSATLKWFLLATSTFHDYSSSLHLLSPWLADLLKLLYFLCFTATLLGMTWPLHNQHERLLSQSLSLTLPLSLILIVLTFNPLQPSACEHYPIPILSDYFFQQTLNRSSWSPHPDGEHPQEKDWAQVRQEGSKVLYLLSSP